MSTKTLFAPLIFILFAFTGAAHASTPTKDLSNAINQVMAALQDKSLSEDAKRDRIRDAVYARFDFWAMSQRVLATNWKKASTAEKKKFKELFGKLLEKTYFTAISTYNDQTVEYGKEKIKGKKATVDTFIVSPDKKIPVDYRMRQKKDGWYVYDVKVEGVSLVSNYRSSFKSIYEQEGMNGLLERMEEKVNAKTEPAAEG